MQKNWKKKQSKKAKRVLAIAAVVLAGTGIGLFHHFKSAPEPEVTEMTDTVVRQNIDTVYNAGGTLKLKNHKAENAMKDATASYRIREVNVKIGDAVHTGDVLYSLDMTDVETQQSVAKQKLANTKAQNELAIRAANRDLSSARAAKAQIENDSAAAVKAAQNNVVKAKGDLAEAEQELDRAKQAEQQAYDELNEPEGTPEESHSPVQEESEPDKKALYQIAVERRKEAQEAVRVSREALDAANASLQQACSTAKANNRAAADDVAAKQDALNTQNLTNQTSIAEQQEEIRKNEEILKYGVVRATMDGTVTEVNIKPGGAYAGDRAVVIGDLDHLMVVVEVESAHVPDIQQGMTAEFTTDATGEDVISGLVTFVSPVPTTGTEITPADPNGTPGTVSASDPSSSGGKATHRVEISLGDTNDRLRVGMKAKVSFILERIPDALCVPTVAIQYDEDGSPYLNVQNPESGETKKIGIETGASNDSYTEILSDAIHEDDVVVYTGTNSGTEAEGDALEGIFYE